MVGKVKVTSPRKPVVRDFTNPSVIKAIWDDADRAVRADRALRTAQVRFARPVSA